MDALGPLGCVAAGGRVTGPNRGLWETTNCKNHDYLGVESGEMETALGMGPGEGEHSELSWEHSRQAGESNR